MFDMVLNPSQDKIEDLSLNLHSNLKISLISELTSGTASRKSFRNLKSHHCSWQNQYSKHSGEFLTQHAVIEISDSISLWVAVYSVVTNEIQKHQSIYLVQCHS